MGKSKKIQTKKNSQFQIESETKGFLITCKRGKERPATAEILQVLEEWKEQENPTTSTAQNSIEDELKAELAALKSKKSKSFTPIETHIDCCLFIRCSAAIDPVSLSHSLLTFLYSAKMKKTRFRIFYLSCQILCATAPYLYYLLGGSGSGRIHG